MDSVAGKKVVILGLGRQGVALARYFAQTDAHVTVSDLKTAVEREREVAAVSDLSVELVLGEHPESLLSDCALLCLSGGVPPQSPFVRRALDKGIALTNDTLLTLQLAAARGLGPTIGITGSNGKTTTTTLVGKMLEASGHHVHVGGNIGAPLLDRMDQIQPGEPIVLELSSFQLELYDRATCYGSLTELGPDVAAILNVTPNHLDRHDSMYAYTAAKLNLLNHLRPHSTVVIDLDDVVTAQLAPQEYRSKERAVPCEWKLDSLLEQYRQWLELGKYQLLTFSREQLSNAFGRQEKRGLMLDDQLICLPSELKLRGNHNISNVLAASAISSAVGATIDAIRQTATTFNGVPHRLEVVAQANGVTWINDSIATSPERAVAGLRSFDAGQQSVILIAGGKDKNLPWQPLADEVLSRVRYLIGFGAYGPEFVRLVQERGGFAHMETPTSATAQRLDQAIELAARVVESEKMSQPHGEVVVLLSPGGTSFDEYEDFEERGEHFRRLVHSIVK